MTDVASGLSAALADRYRIERRLGEGGMATVYLAEDLKHKRKVALKVLRPELAAVLGAERFLQEITTTASLQHPHILPLFDSGKAVAPPLRDAERETGGEVFLYYVMPFIDGETLREKLNRETQLGIDEALRIATNVADALDYAHRHNVIHRDIKPENILLHDGRPVVADFGIALAVSAAGGGRMTETGLSLGTPHYMSPEQAMGDRTLDARTDVYALGCVLYEMLAGEPPFTGPTAQAILAKVVTATAEPVTTYRKTVPAHIAAAVHTALEKLPADRFSGTALFANALGDPSYTGASSAPASPTGGAFRTRTRLALPSAALAVLALLIAAWGFLRPVPPAPVTRYGLALPPSQSPNPGWRALPSPDGTAIVYVGPSEGAATQLWVKPRDSYAASPLTGTLGAEDFVLSPDGEWIAFASGGQVKKIQIVGGAAITLVDRGASGAPGALAWLDDGQIVYARVAGRGFDRISDTGGTVSPVWQSDSLRGTQLTPLPRGRGVLFQGCPGGCVDPDLWALDFRSDSAHLVLRGALWGQYVAVGGGQLVYVQRDGGMLAAPFDLGSLQTRGGPVPILDSVSVLATDPLISISASGTLVMRSGAPLAALRQYELVWVDRSGHQTPVDSTWKFQITRFAGNHGWALSPDATRLAIGLGTDGNDDIWVKRLPGGPLSRLSTDDASDFRPRWTPDGGSIIFGSSRSVSGLYQRRADGTGVDSLLLEGSFVEGALSPDGGWFLVRAGGASAVAGGRDILGFRPGADTALMPLVATAFDEEAIALSPDGRWLAYQSDETGQNDVFVRPFPNTEGGKRQVSNGGGTAPLWSRDGRELFFVNANKDMMATEVTQEDMLQLDEPRKLFHLSDELSAAESQYYTPWDIGPDGRFIMVRYAMPTAALNLPLIVVDNFFEELKAKVGNR